MMRGQLAAQGVRLEDMDLDLMLDYVYGRWVEALDPPEGTTPEMAIRQLNNQLGVDAWRVPGDEKPMEMPYREPGAPVWWFGEEDASDSFLAAMGVNLDG
jgi:hypothetical protein